MHGIGSPGDLVDRTGDRRECLQSSECHRIEDPGLVEAKEPDVPAWKHVKEWVEVAVRVHLAQEVDLEERRTTCRVRPVNNEARFARVKYQEFEAESR